MRQKWNIAKVFKKPFYYTSSFPIRINSYYSKVAILLGFLKIGNIAQTRFLMVPSLVIFHCLENVINNKIILKTPVQD